MAGSAVTALPNVQAGEVLVAGNHGNHGHKDNNKKHKNSNGNKKGDKSKGNNGVRDHGKGEGRDNAGQGKGGEQKQEVGVLGVNRCKLWSATLQNDVGWAPSA